MGFARPTVSISGDVVETRALVTKAKKVWAYSVKVEAFGGTFDLTTKDEAIFRSLVAGQSVVVEGAFESYQGKLRLALVSARKVAGFAGNPLATWLIPGQVGELRPLTTKEGEVWAYSIKLYAKGASFDVQTQDAELFGRLVAGQSGYFEGGFEPNKDSFRLKLVRFETITSDGEAQSSSVNGDGVLPEVHETLAAVR